MSQRVIYCALLIAVIAFAIGASIFTQDWIRCTDHYGGRGCDDPRDRAAGAWGGLATSALALATNTRKERKEDE